MGKKVKKKTNTQQGGAGGQAAAAPPVKSNPKEEQRSLNKIYDALETGNNKVGLKLINTAISKHGELDILVALRAMLLARFNKIEEAQLIIKQLEAKMPSDPTTCSTMLLVYRHLNQLYRAAELYENATKKDPKNKALLLPLFNAYGRASAYGKQQQTAIAMYSKFKDTKYLFWSATCMMLQHLHAAKGPNKMLQLAQAMILRSIPKDAPVTAEESLLLLNIMQKQCALQDAIDLLQGPYAEAFRKDAVESRRLLGALYVETGQYEEAKGVFALSLNPDNNPDDWHFLKAYIGCQLHLAGQTEGKEVDPATLEKSPCVIECRAFLQSLQSNENNSQRPRRGPFLAELELEYLITAFKDDAAVARATAILKSYFFMFGTKPCFFLDIDTYLQKLPSEMYSDLCKEFQEVLEQRRKQATTPKQQEQCCQLNVSLAQIRRRLATDCSGKRTAASLTTYTLALYKQYTESRQSTTQNLEPTERGIGDTLLQLCVFALIELYNVNDERQYLIDGILLLERGLKEYSKFNFQWKLLLLRLYCHPAIGAAYKAYAIYQTLGIKHIQMDSMSHLMMADCVRYGLFQEAHDICAEVSDFHSSQHKGIPDWIWSAFKNANYSKVEEFVVLQDRFERSLQLRLCEAETHHLALTLGVKSEKESDDVQTMAAYLSDDSKKLNATLSRLVANSDFSVASVFERESLIVLSTQLNRPSPSLFESSWHVAPGEQLTLTGGDDDTYAVGSVSISFLKLRRLVTGMVHRISLGDEKGGEDDSLRASLASLSDVLVSLALLPSTTDDKMAIDDVPTTTHPNQEENLQFTMLDWRVVYHTLEVSACIIESAKASQAWMEGLDTLASDLVENGLDKHTSRWGIVQRSLLTITSLLTRLRPGVTTVFVLKKDQKQRVDPSVIPRISSFLRNSVSTLVTVMQAWVEALPSKKSLRKRKGKLSDDAKAADDQATEILNNVRSSMKGLGETLNHLLNDVSTEIKMMDESAKEIDGCLQHTSVFDEFNHILEKKFVGDVLRTIEDSSKKSSSTLAKNAKTFSGRLSKLKWGVSASKSP